MKMTSRRPRRRGKFRLKKLFKLVGIGIVLLGLGWGWTWWQRGWDRKAQINLVLEGRKGRLLILSLTPAKSLVVGLIVPANLLVETPWFGSYQAGKLSLLAEQEGNKAVFDRSLSYFLALALDQSWLKTGLDLEAEPELIRRQLFSFWAPWKQPQAFKFWLFLRRKDLVWQWFNLASWTQEKSLPDGTKVLTLNREQLSQSVLSDLTDPLVKNEAITIGVFNLGEQSGLAQRTAQLIEHFGGRVIEIGDQEGGVSDCLIILADQRLRQSYTFARLKSVLGCSWRVGDRNSQSAMAEIRILVKNVKI